VLILANHANQHTVTIRSANYRFEKLRVTARFPSRHQTDRHFCLTSEKIRYQGEENDRKVFESSSPAKYKSNCTEDDKKSTEFYRSTYIYKDGADISTGHKHT